MDCYRLIADDSLAEMHARDPCARRWRRTATVISPMRKVEAEIALGVPAARRRNMTQAIDYGDSALSISRCSLPSILTRNPRVPRALIAGTRPRELSL